MKTWRFFPAGVNRPDLLQIAVFQQRPDQRRRPGFRGLGTDLQRSVGDQAETESINGRVYGAPC